MKDFQQHDRATPNSLGRRRLTTVRSLNPFYGEPTEEDLGTLNRSGRRWFAQHKRKSLKRRKRL